MMSTVRFVHAEAIQYMGDEDSAMTLILWSERRIFRSSEGFLKVPTHRDELETLVAGDWVAKGPTGLFVYKQNVFDAVFKRFLR